MTVLRDVYLHGTLGRRFGRCFRIAVASPAEAVRALCCQLPMLRAAIRDGVYRVVTGRHGSRRDRPEEELAVGFSTALHIVPVVAGAGGKGLGIGLAIAGVALLAAAFAAPLLLGGGLLASATIGGISTGTIATVGAAMALAGASILLAPKPKTSDDPKMESFLFGGLPNRGVAGRCVPVTFGEFRVAVVPISVQLKNIRLGTANVRNRQ